MTSARAASCAATLVALATLYAGIHWGSTVGGGADSYGYVSQASLWRSGRLTIREPIARQSPWPLALDTWAPLGYRPAPDSRDTIVPLYSPGLPMLMAAFQLVGGFCAAFVVVPVCGALAVWLTFVLGQRLFGVPSASVAAALLVATSPIFLYQLMNPMSDVPVTAAWALSVVLLVSDRPLAAGLAAAAAILIRPNLAPVAVALALWASIASRSGGRFLLGLLPGAAAVAAINTALYGAPWTSGYGRLAELYAVRYVQTNARQFASWTLQTQTPLVALLLIPLIFPRLVPRAGVASPRLLAGGMLAAVLVSYLFYVPFDAWWYLRFLLPMWPLGMVLMSIGSLGAIRTATRAIDPRLNRWHCDAVVWGIMTAVLSATGIQVAANRSAFDIGRGERKYVDVARFVASHTDPDAVMISLQHSGTLRLYAGRLTLRFDQLDGLWLDRVVSFLRDRGRHPYVVLDGGEVENFRRRFEGNETARLDWSPFAKLEAPEVFVFDAAERASTREPVVIGAVAMRRVGWRCDVPYDRMPLRTE